MEHGIGEAKGCHLPLELFDDESMELYSPPEKWIDRKEEGDPGARGFSRFFKPDGSHTWESCWVLEYSKEKDMFKIVFCSELMEKSKYVNRLNLRFAEESESAFFRRIELAKERQNEAEQVLRTRIYLEKDETMNVPPMSVEQIRRIIRLGAPKVPIKFSR